MQTGSQPAEALAQKSIEKELQSLQGSLWHGHVERARERIEELQWELVLTAGESENRDKLWKQLREFDGYIRNHRGAPSELWRAIPERGADLDGIRWNRL